jgi:hypothetical protein
MKKIIVTLLLISSTYLSQAQTLDEILKAADKIIKGNTNNGNTNTGNTNNSTNPIGNILGNGLSNNEIVGGLKEALQIGAKEASSSLNVKNGFFGNQLIKILMPPEVKKVEATLRQFGMSKLCDNLILSLNRAAEDASGKAVPIFINAITSMSITDGLNILRGGNNAATNFLKGATTIALTEAFRPVINQSLGKVNATKYWSDVFKTYNKLPITRTKVNTDLTGYVTERALNGLFVKVAEQEQNIRTNPAAQVTNLLQRVFGGR